MHGGLLGTVLFLIGQLETQPGLAPDAAPEAWQPPSSATAVHTAASAEPAGPADADPGSVALAPQPAPAEPAAPRPRGRFSLGGGLELQSSPGNDLYTMLVLSSTLGGYPTLIDRLTQGERPAARAFVEVQLLDNLALLASLAASYGFDRNENFATNYLLPDYGHAYGGAASVGSRFLFNPDGLVEVSLYGALVLQFEGRTTIVVAHPDLTGGGDETQTQYRSSSLVGGLQAGLILERELLADLFVRLQLNLLHLGGYYATWSVENVTADSAPSNADLPTDWGIETNLRFLPSLELRYRF